jgi:hypothetical protein
MVGCEAEASLPLESLALGEWAGGRKGAGISTFEVSYFLEIIDKVFDVWCSLSTLQLLDPIRSLGTKSRRQLTG